MSERLEVEHRGYKIFYNENADEWRCQPLDVEDMSLASVKRKIDRILAKASKLAATIPALAKEHYGPFRPAKIISVAATTGYKGKPQVWITVEEPDWKTRGRGEARMERKKVDPETLFPDTPEVQAMVREWERLAAAQAQATKAVTDYLESIPRFRFEDIPKPGVPEEE